jgi:hypothetical protein
MGVAEARRHLDHRGVEVICALDRHAQQVLELGEADEDGGRRREPD